MVIVRLFVFAFTLNSMSVLFFLRFDGCLLSFAVGFGVFLFFGLWEDQFFLFPVVFDHVDCLHIDFFIFFELLQLFSGRVDFPVLSVGGTSVCGLLLFGDNLILFFLDRFGGCRVVGLNGFRLFSYLYIEVDPVSDGKVVVFYLVDVLVDLGKRGNFNYSHSKSLMNLNINHSNLEF
jgi:uncharacterized membrane protein required for colicin V production